MNPIIKYKQKLEKLRFDLSRQIAYLLVLRGESLNNYRWNFSKNRLNVTWVDAQGGLKEDGGGIRIRIVEEQGDAEITKTIGAEDMTTDDLFHLLELMLHNDLPEAWAKHQTTVGRIAAARAERELDKD